MVEKWMQRKPNPYVVKRIARRPVNPYVSKVIRPRPLHLHASPNKSFGKSKAYYGMPSQLFKDSDKDGVYNVFDCKPKNKRKTDVMSPANFGSGYMDMYQRQENARLQRLYLKQQQEAAKQQQEAYDRQLAELQRIEGETSTVYVYPQSSGTSVSEFQESKSYSKDINEIIQAKRDAEKAAAAKAELNKILFDGKNKTPLMSVPIVVTKPAPLLIPVKKPSLGTSILNVAKTVYKVATTKYGPSLSKK